MTMRILDVMTWNKCMVSIFGIAAVAFVASANAPDTQYFVTGGSLSSGDGYMLTLPSFSCDTVASLVVSGNLGNGTDICIESERLNVGKDSNLEQFMPGISILER